MKVYNTLSARKEEFLPQGDEVKMYVCGITPYDHSHIGHGMSYIVFDVIQRYLRFRGYRVKYIQNITDIDDKIINRANQLSIPASELAEKYARGYFKDMADLNIAPADIYPRATQEIAKIIEVIQGLVDKGHAYAAQGSVYFRIRSKDDYGKLAHRSLKSMMAGARIEAGEEKEHPMDFVLWKATKPGEPSWPSPWGEGRPGWHIECSAMSLKYLGETLDIHGGGQDLIFPHHENEIAQSESFTGKKPFVKYWLHNGLLQLGEEKMSKSLGNLITIQEALQMYSADAIRIFVLSSHYRSPLTFSDEALEAAESGAERLRQVTYGGYASGAKKAKINTETYRDRFIEVMDDDFGTPQALATLFDLAREINRADEAGYEAKGARGALKELAGVLGLILERQEQTFETSLYNEFRNFYQRKNYDEATEYYTNAINRLDNNKRIYTHLSKSLRNQFVHGTYPSLDNAAESTQIYSHTLKSLRDQMARRNFVEALESLSTISSSATTNTTEYISLRNQLRETKQWQLADKIRSRLEETGIALEDTPKGTVWRRKC